MESVELNAREQVARLKLSKADSKRAKKKRDSSSSRSATGVPDIVVDVQQLPAVPVSHQQLSDSSDSNNGNSAKRPFFNTAECTATHEGTQVFNVILPVNIDTLFQTLYSNSKFLEDFHESRKIFDIIRTEWADVNVGTNNGVLRTSTFNSKMPIKQNIGSKFSIVSEHISLMDCSVTGCLYSINRVVTNDGIPYGDTFEIQVHHCLVRTMDDHTMFSVNILVKFKKSPFSIIKNLIEKGTMAGMFDFYTDLLEHLQSHFCSPPAKGKRHSRNTVKAPVLVTREMSPSLGSLDELSQKPTAYTEISHDLADRHNIAAKSSRRKSIVWFVIAVMFGITALNIGLFIKLMALEGSTTVYSTQTKSDLLLFASENRSDDEWMQLFQSREVEHQQHMYELKSTLLSTIDVLKQAQNYLTDLVNSLHPTVLTDET